MATITVDYWVLTKGYEISGDVRSGYHATVPYLVAWADAFTFADEMLGHSQAFTVGPVTYYLPYQFPASSAVLYAQRFRIEPCGYNGAPLGETQGLAPGDFFEWAKITVEFETPPQTMQAQDDPQNLNQLDPANPITMCSQSVRSSGKMETRKNGSYVYASGSFAGKPVPGDFAVPTSESKLVLTFPRVPYLPWQLIRPYLNTINSASILNCGIGELLLEDMDTKVEPAPGGTMQQQLQLSFAVSPQPGQSWNMLPQPDGLLATVCTANSYRGSQVGIYATSDFRQIFSQIVFDPTE